MLYSKFFNIRRTQFDQSSPVQPVLNFRGGSTSTTDKQMDGRMEILVSNISGQKYPKIAKNLKKSHFFI